jgi:eukaryotic-like serine/threonine-protein kinase
LGSQVRSFANDFHAWNNRRAVAGTVRRCPRCQSQYEPEARFCPVDGTATVLAQLAPTETMDPLVGMLLGGRYRCERKLGQGGMGAVYRAEHVGLGKPVAVKVLLERFAAQREALTRFHKEARAASMIAHENIVDVIDVGEDSGHAYIVMELLGGRDLAQLLRDEGPLPPARAIGLLRQVCAALAAAHAKGIIHRDMKPENVFVVQREGKPDVVKLMDFGISKVRQAHEESLRLTESGAVMGTPMYMSPEQARGDLEIDLRVDVYSVGVMCYEMVIGEPPFRHPTYLGLLSMHLNQKPEPPRKRNPNIPPELDRVILRALEKDPAKRFQSMAEFEAALTAVEGRMTPQSVAPVPSASRWPWVVAAAVVLVGGTGAFVWKQLQPPAAAPIVAPELPKKEAAAPRVETTASVTFRTDPPGADVWIDQVPVGKSPITQELKPGPHVFSFAAAGYAKREVQRTLEPGENKDVDVALEKEQPKSKSRPVTKKKEQPVTKPETHEKPTDDGHKANPYQ